MVIFLDTMTLCESLDNALQEIMLATTDDFQLRTFLDDWKTILIKAQARLPSLLATVSSFPHPTSPGALRTHWRLGSGPGSRPP